MRHTSGLILLLIIMLNHAVLACDAMVMHLPQHDHSHTSLSHSHSSFANTDMSGALSDTEDEHSHPQHAHVSCHIAYYRPHNAKPVNDVAIATGNPTFNAIHYQPPVPPPNART